MTEPTAPRAVPGPPRPGSGPAPAGEPGTVEARPAGDHPPDDQPFEDLDERPVAEHVAVFEAEHSRLQRELGTIDQL
jgi:hypothetical protein